MSTDAANAKLNGFVSLQPARFNYLVRFVVEKIPEWDRKVSVNVEMLLNEEVSPESKRLKLKFTHATDVRIGDLNGTLACVVVIRNIADRGLEDVIYRVVEEGEKSFSFNCQDFEYDVVG
jgi:hypothetical protein